MPANGWASIHDMINFDTLVRESNHLEISHTTPHFDKRQGRQIQTEYKLSKKETSPFQDSVSQRIHKNPNNFRYS
jgi:hypothetical protein